MVISKTDYHWKPIEPLSEKERGLDVAGIRPLTETWREYRGRLHESEGAQVEEFTRRLVRRLSVETGILERLYDVDRGTTEALVAQGFAEDLVSHSSTNIPPPQLVDILRDQEAAIQLVVDCVAHSRDLTKGVIHELHAVLTRHQETTTAIDQFGNHIETALLRGRFKEQPNNPRRPDGSVHEYCPPVHVEAEMDRLLGWLREYGADEPVLVAAWLHHRFTQIHPYQDGNGRVARSLTTLVLLRAGLLPVVIDRTLRAEYIEALEVADRGGLSTLAELLARQERTAILQALSVGVAIAASPEKPPSVAVSEAYKEKFAKRRARRLAELRAVDDVALRLRSFAEEMIQARFRALQTTLVEIGKPELRIHPGGTDHGTAHWYKFEVAQTAKEAGKYANFGENHYFVKASARAGRERLVFVVSFHHVGRELTGIMEATAFSKLESFEDSEDRRSVSQDFRLCSLEPFVFTYHTVPENVVQPFERWLETSLTASFAEYLDRL